MAVAGEHTWKTVRPRRHDPCIRHASMARLNRLAEMECPRRRISASTATAAAEFTGFECLHAVIIVCDMPVERLVRVVLLQARPATTETTL